MAAKILQVSILQLIQHTHAFVVGDIPGPDENFPSWATTSHLAMWIHKQ